MVVKATLKCGADKDAKVCSAPASRRYCRIAQPALGRRGTHQGFPAACEPPRMAKIREGETVLLRREVTRVKARRHYPERLPGLIPDRE